MKTPYLILIKLPNLDEDDEIDAELDEVNEDVMANEQLRDEANGRHDLRG